jgi:hypothetical protein
MQIFIDESGLFVPASKAGSWSVVAAFAVPHKAAFTMESILGVAKRLLGREIDSEIKLKDFGQDEAAYFRFLENIQRIGGLLFATGYNSSINGPSAVVHHQRMQVSKVMENIDKMRHEGGRQNVLLTASQLGKLSLQLYTQLYCQITLMREVVRLSATYYAQRQPEALAAFMWRIDRCGAPPSAYERSFEQMTPLMLQTVSLSSPLVKIRSPEFDYSYLETFEMDVPSFFKDDYGIDVKGDRGLDLHKLIRGDMEFVDSKHWAGIQVVDLIVSGIGRCLRGGFQNNERAAVLLGSLMVEAESNNIPIKLVSFREGRVALDSRTARLVNLMRANSRPMMLSAESKRY